MNYDEAVRYIEDTAKFGSKLGLERTEMILNKLGNPHKKIKTIHIAGTNGKGSTTAMVTNVLIESGYSVGTYISPYIEEFEERIQVNNTNIPKADLADVITRLSEVIKEVAEEGYGNPTQFEIITCAGFMYFYEKKVDYAVVEVGLGGRLDSTNVISPEICAIASISLDHMQILGDTLEKIAGEKAGIIKEKTPVVLYPQGESVTKVIEAAAALKNAPVIKVNKDNALYQELVEGEDRFYQRIRIKGKDSYELLLPLLGVHQIQNCNVVINICEALKENGVNITRESIISGIKNVRWPGRMEVMGRKPIVLLDGAHNIDGITKLKESIENYFKYDKLILVLGILADKQVDDMIKVICPMAERVIAVTPHSERGELCNELKDKILQYEIPCEAFEDYGEAYDKAKEYCSEDSLLVISGSLYMVGDMRKLIRHKNEII